MPDRGLLSRGRYGAGPIASHGEGERWALAGARLAQVTFEVDREAALAHMPEDVSRPVPCYARLVVIEAADSPVGPLRLAALHVGARYELFPRNALVTGVVDGPVDAVADALGSQFQPGHVEIEREGAHLTASIADEQSPLATLELPALVAVDPTMLRWDPWLGLAAVDSVPVLIEYSIRPRATEAFLSKGAVITTAPGISRTHTWRQLRNINTISACYLEGEVDVVLPVVQPPVP